MYGFTGVCLTCPIKCLQCELATNNISFLQCTQCADGLVEQNNMCVSSCNKLIGMSIVNESCQTCADPSCIDCSFSTDQCYSCNPLTIKMLNPPPICSCSSALM